MGFAPADKPKIVVAVMIEFGGHGTRAAAIASKIIAAYLHVTPIVDILGGRLMTVSAAFPIDWPLVIIALLLSRLRASRSSTRPARPTSLTGVAQLWRSAARSGSCIVAGRRVRA